MEFLIQTEYYNTMDLYDSLITYLDEDVAKKLTFSLNENRSYCLLINDKKIDETFIKENFKTMEKHPFIPKAFYYNGEIDQPGKSYLFDNGAYYIIDASSLLVGYLLDVRDEDLVLDMCAAPGGKSISLLLKNRNFFCLSNDLNKSRALLMAQNFEKLGIINAFVSSVDFKNIYKKYQNTFDKIILDAPCSGSGMFRKNLNVKEDWSIEKVKRLSLIQKELLELAFYMLKPGGIISYSTCSLNYEENEEVIISFLKNHQEAEIINLKSIEGEYRHNSLKEAIHLFPCFYKGEGMFISQIKKIVGF